MHDDDILYIEDPDRQLSEENVIEETVLLLNIKYIKIPGL